VNLSLASQPPTPEGHGRASSGRWAHHGVGPTWATLVARPPNGYAGVLGAQRVGLVVAVRLGREVNQ
jgi:hypothetical protein